MSILFDDDDSRNVPVILLVGATKAGKSTFINTLVPDAVPIGDTVRSCTKACQFVEAKVGAHKVYLIDTPGMDDTFRDEADVFIEIAKALVAVYNEKMNFKGVLFLQSIENRSVNGTMMKQWEIIDRICGIDGRANLRFISTFWRCSGAQPQEFVGREPQILEEFRTHVHLGTEELQHDRFYMSRQSAEFILLQHMKNEDVVLELQKEAVDSRLSLSETTAGKLVCRDYSEKKEKAQQNLYEIRKMSPDDEQKRSVTTLNQTIQEAENNMQKLHFVLADLVQQQISDARRKAKTFAEAIAVVIRRTIRFAKGDLKPIR